ncbi:MAG TPA: glycine cleavage system aminomethyltransferase GcvT [Candidatus Bipolaricaulota bacterium]
MTLKHTALYSRHQAQGAKLVEYAGFAMPLQYTGILQEHDAVRRGAGAFDVSHMGELLVRGPQALDFLQYLLPNDTGQLAPDQVLYSCMCYPDGGTVDDLLVYRRPDHFLLVVNAANADKDYDWVKQQAGRFDVSVENASDRFSQLAIQGPKAQALLEKAIRKDLSTVKYYWATEATLYGEKTLLSRTGYTGEDGFEIYSGPQAACRLWDDLIKAGVVPIGLGARDSLRFEACLPLYGHELDATTSPVEAGVGWTVKDKPNEYLGKQVLLRHKRERPRHLVGLQMVEAGVARQGYKVVQGSTPIGVVTSGMKAPTVDAFLAMALVKQPLALGAPVQVDIRGALKQAKVVKLPFYKGSVKRG